MAGSPSGANDEGIHGINIVPLVDIVLVLLIIFMVTTHFVEGRTRRREGIPVELPAAATGSAVSSSLVSVTIARDGSLYVDGERTTRDALVDAVVGARRPAEVEVLVAADQDVSHGTVVGVVDLLRRRGVQRFAFRTRPERIEPVP